MTDELDALLAGVHDNPRDVVPRLVYADWLEDRGENEYAEMIRLGIKIVEGEPVDPRVRKTQRQRRYELMQELMRHWGVDRRATMFWTADQTVLADRGYLSAGELIAGGPVWPPYFRPRSVNFNDYRGHESAILASEYMTRAHELAFSDPSAGQGGDEETADDDLLGRLATLPVPKLRRLRFCWGTLSYPALSRFAESPLLERLQVFAFGISRRLYQYSDIGSEPEIEITNPGGGRMVRRLAEVAVEYPGFAPLE